MVQSPTPPLLPWWLCLTSCCQQALHCRLAQSRCYHCVCCKCIPINRVYPRLLVSVAKRGVVPIPASVCNHHAGCWAAGPAHPALRVCWTLDCQVVCTVMRSSSALHIQPQRSEASSCCPHQLAAHTGLPTVADKVPFYQPVALQQQHLASSTAKQQYSST